jgi:hypothetical protein
MSRTQHEIRDPSSIPAFSLRNSLLRDKAPAVLLQQENSNIIASKFATTTRQTVVCHVVNGAGHRISSSFDAATAALWAWNRSPTDSD